MVCVPTSKGCAHCLAKHVKCDETRPDCERCRKAGLRCPGYRKALVVKHYDASGSRTNNFSSRPKQVHRVKQMRSVPYESSSFDTFPVVTDETWLPSSSNLLSTFWSDVESVLLNAISPEWQLLPPSDRHTGKWLQEVVCRSKNSTLLSRSIRALSATYVGKVTGATDLIMVGQSYYATALGDMRGLLSENDNDIASVQSAAMLLTFFELLNPSSNQAWIQHAGGVTRIMMLRGPSAYTQGFDKVCYMAMRNYAVNDALISGSACFLDDDSWLIANESAQDLSEIMFRSHIKLPALLHDLQNTAVNGDFPQIVLAKALALRGDMLCSFHRWLDSKRVIGVFPSLSTASDSLNDHIYMFPELQSLILHCSHYAGLIVINKIIIDCWKEAPLNLAYECQQAAQEIAACVNQSQSSLLTSMSLQFWLQAAAHGCSEVDAPWFAEKIRHLSLQHC